VVTGWLIGVALRLNKDGLNHRIAILFSTDVVDERHGKCIISAAKGGLLAYAWWLHQYGTSVRYFAASACQPDVQESSSERLHLSQHFPGVTGITTATVPIISAIAKGAL
jgi:hypothetical protein